MNSKPPRSTTGKIARLHTISSQSSVANSIARLIEENEKLRGLAALLTLQLEVMRGSTKEEDQPTAIRRCDEPVAVPSVQHCSAGSDWAPRRGIWRDHRIFK
jgi:hypothetical protein